MIPLLRAADVHAQDAAAPVGVEVLMERAGYRVASAARALLGRTYGARIVVVAGRGNNAGDGFVAARILEDWGARTEVVAVGGDPTGPAASAFARCPARRVPIERMDAALGGADLVIDAMLGVGLNRPPDGAFADAIAAIDAWGGPVLSIDVPSGVDADTGHVPGVAVNATWTLTLGGLKPGLLFEPGVNHAGRVRVAGIGLGREPASAWALERDDVARLLPVRAPDAHKSKAGRVLVIAGSAAMPGAAVLATSAAVRAGAGLTVLAAPEDVCRVVVTAVPEATTVPLPSSEGVLDLKGVEALTARMPDARAAVIGPGLGRHPATLEAARSLISTLDVPTVIDADGLTALEGHLDLIPSRRAATVLTPHTGEFTRLFGAPTDRLAAAEDAARSGAIVVLKGPGTVVAGGPRTYVNATGDPALAQGGSGDVLAGSIAAFLAAGGGETADVAAAAVWVHGRAGERLAARRRPQPATASDLALELGPAMHEVMHG